MYIHNLDPDIISFGFFTLRWYSLSYILGILLGWWLGFKLLYLRKNDIPFEVGKQLFDNFITYIIISLILGGRIGYVIFYNPAYYLLNPLDIIKIWEGGMSFHGALLGIIFGTIIFSKKNNLNPFVFLDIVASVSPIGLLFGRIANFINGELYGKITDVSWGVIFPLVDNNPRHPSQIYEAILEGFVLFIILLVAYLKTSYKKGICSSLFLIFYSVFRIFCENFREPDNQLGYIFYNLSMGTLLSLIMLFSGIIIFFITKKNEYQ